MILDSKKVTRLSPYFSHLLKNLSYVDETKVAVWGWSYGGFLAARILAEDTEEIIKCAAAVAPVTRWQLYGKREFERSSFNSC